MKKDEVIEHVCQTVALVYHSMRDYAEPSDGFCLRCQRRPFRDSNYQHSGKTLRYVRDAVVAKLKADGYAIDFSFDPITGDEITSPPSVQSDEDPHEKDESRAGIPSFQVNAERRAVDVIL